MQKIIHPSERWKKDLLKQHLSGDPIKLIAERVGLQPFHVLRALRSQGRLSDLEADDLVFIAKHSAILPRSVIAEVLGINKQQVNDFQKKHSLNEITEIKTDDQAKTIFKFLVEQDYSLEEKGDIKLLGKSILQGGYYGLYKYCIQNKYIPVLGWLAQITYPDELRSFMFGLPNGHAHFESVEELNDALWWCFEKMTGLVLDDYLHDEAAIQMLLMEPKIGFGADRLRNEFIQRDTWNKFYRDFSSLKSGMIKHIGIGHDPNRRRWSSSKIKPLLQKARGVQKLDTCEVCSHNGYVEIHHIVPVRGSEHLLDNNAVNSIPNLIVLCPNHHRAAAEFDWMNSYNQFGLSGLRLKLMQFLTE